MASVLRSSSGKFPFPLWAVVLAFFLPFLGGAFMALVTGSIWEDGLITLRQAINGVEGRGLTYNPDELVHGFTSPFNVLFLGLFYKLFGSSDPLNAIYGYRLLSLCLLGGTGLLILRLFFLNGSRSPLWPLLAVAFLSLDAKVMLFSINGQEPAFTIFFLALGLTGILSPTKKVRLLCLTLAIAGLQWNRPEGFIFSAGLLLGGCFIAAPEKRGETFREYLTAIFAAVLLYSPWILATTFYYGSPIPNTIHAKGSAGSASLFLEKIFPSLWQVAASTLTPSYFNGLAGGKNIVLGLFSAGLLATLFLLPFSRFKNRLGLLCVFSALAAYAYLCLVAATSQNYPWAWPFPWYYAPLSFPLILGLCSALPRFGQWPDPRHGRRLLLRCVIFCGVVLLVLFGREAYLTRNLQAGVELGVRQQVGLWLRDHIQPGDTVYCECIGYIGFHSGAKILNYPGLTSRKIVAVKRAGRFDFLQLMHALQPDWLALRKIEADAARRENLLGNYRMRREFTVPEELAGRDGLGPQNADAHFFVFQRIGPSAQPGIR